MSLFVMHQIYFTKTLCQFCTCILLSFVLVELSNAKEEISYGDLQATVLKVVDGDTLEVNICNVNPIIGQAISVRIDDIDTPEIRGKCEAEKQLANKAKNTVISFLPIGSQVILKDIKRDMYFRILAKIILPDGTNVGDELVRLNLAYLYDGKTKQSWCQ